MNRRQTKKRSISSGASIGLVVLMAMVSVPLAPSTAGASHSESFTYGFRCKATAVRVVPEVKREYLTVGLANGTPGESPEGDFKICNDDSDSAVPERSISSGGVTVRTTDAYATTDVVEGHRATAEAGVTEFNFEHISSLPGPLRVRVAHSRASATCIDGKPVLAGSSKVLSVISNGVELLPAPVEEPMKIQIIKPFSMTSNWLYLNQQDRDRNSELTQRAVRYGFTESSDDYDLVLGESRIGFYGPDPTCVSGTSVLSVADAPPVAEGTPGTPGHTQGVARFALSLSAPAATDVSVSYATAPGTALGTDDGVGGDYKNTKNTPATPLTFAPGEVSKVIEVPVTMDSASAETDEEFFLDVSTTSPAVVIADGRGVAAIINDDPASVSTLSVNDVTVIEGVAGQFPQAVFTVSLWPPSAAPVSVRAFTADGTAHPLPHPSDDYVQFNQRLNFAPGETAKQVAVTIKGDNVDERDETYYLALEEAVGAQREKRLGAGVIVSDEAFPTVSIDDATAPESLYGRTGELKFTVSLSAPSFRQISVNFATTDGTARSTNHSLFGPADYQSVSGVLIFNPGETAKTVVVAVNDDNIYEPPEDLILQLPSAVNAIQVKRAGRGTIEGGY